METWRQGSFRNASFFKRLSLGRPRRLRRQGSVLSQASTAGGDHEEYSNREVIRELRGRPDGRRLPLWGDEQPRATLLAPPKPPRLYRESSSCPNILEPPPAYTTAYSATLPSALSLAGALHHYSEDDLLDTPPFQGTPAPDLSDPFFSFKVDLGISLLEEVLQMLREQFPKRTRTSTLILQAKPNNLHTVMGSSFDPPPWLKGQQRAPPLNSDLDLNSPSTAPELYSLDDTLVVFLALVI